MNRTNLCDCICSWHLGFEVSVSELVGGLWVDMLYNIVWICPAWNIASSECGCVTENWAWGECVPNRNGTVQNTVAVFKNWGKISGDEDRRGGTLKYGSCRCTWRRQPQGEVCVDYAVRWPRGSRWWTMASVVVVSKSTWWHLAG